MQKQQLSIFKINKLFEYKATGNNMKFLQSLLRESSNKDEELPEETPKDTDLPDEELPDTPPEDDVPSEEITDNDDDDSDEEDIGEVADSQGYQKAQTELKFEGKMRTVTTLTKDEELGGLKLHTMYIINPKTGSWVYKAGLVGEDDNRMAEFRTGEDPSSLLKHLKKKKKISPHQAVEYLNPPLEKEKS